MKILHLEDDANDAELVRRLLEDELPECEITLVDSEVAYLREIRRGEFDVVLSDFALVGFDGTDALKIAKREAPEIPFIFLSGNIGEDRAIEAVRAGAHDYVLKDRVKRLVTAIQAGVRESHERKRVRIMEAERSRLAATLENSPDFVGLANPDGSMLYLNRAARDLLALPEGIPIEELDILTIRPTEVHDAARENFAIAARDGTWSGESILLARDGRCIPVSQVLIAHRGANGAVEYLSTVMRDLTTRKRSEALVYGQNQVLEMIAGGEPLTETLTALLRFIEGQCDEMICAILLMEEGGQRLRHCAAPRLPREFIEAIDGQPIGPTAGSCGTAAHRRASVMVDDIATDPLWADYRHLALPLGLHACWSSPIFDVHQHLLGTFAVYLKKPALPDGQGRQLIDIGIHIAAICLSRHDTERRLRDQADILNKASDAIVVTDLTDRVTFWNHGAEVTFGWTAPEAVGRQIHDLFPPDAVPEIEAARAGAIGLDEWRGELRLPDKKSAVHIMDSRVTIIRDDAGRPEGRLSIATDITAKKRMEEQFFRAQRLESIGMLAAGIAHDLNNVLAPILLAAPMLRDTTSDPGDLRMISTLEKSAERGAALVRQILSFAHGADGEHQLIQVKHLLRDIATFVEETFPKSIKLKDEIPFDLWPIKGNATQLHQVLLNLCVNARDAMPGGGTLTLRSENCVLDQAAAAQIEGGRTGAFLVLHIQDTGTGIAPDVLAHMWEPFYTTKATDKGTGLGLSTVRGIVESHGGFATVTTALNQGTTFRIYIEAAENTVGQARPTSVSPVSARGVGELVLVVDDEVSIRNMSATMLARHGYRVLTAADGGEAIGLFAPRSQEIRLLITDLSMPNLDGIALAGIVHRLNPSVKIILVTGLGTDSNNELSRQQIAHSLLIKPFRSEDLLGMVHTLLNGKNRPGG